MISSVFRQHRLSMLRLRAHKPERYYFDFKYYNIYVYGLQYFLSFENSA